jgi:hypothetical protein
MICLNKCVLWVENKCGKTQFRHAKDILGSDYIPSSFSSSKSEDEG